jgi:hypothetical protein
VAVVEELSLFGKHGAAHSVSHQRAHYSVPHHGSHRGSNPNPDISFSLIYAILCSVCETIRGTHRYVVNDALLIPYRCVVWGGGVT